MAINLVAGTPALRKLFVAALAMALLCGPTAIKAATANPESFVEAISAKVIDILKSETADPAARERRFRQLFVGSFDAPAIGKFVLAGEWRKLSAEQRSQYLDRFSKYIAAIYAIQFSHYEGETFKITGPAAKDGADSFVKAALEKPSKAPIMLSFRVRETQGAYKIVDVAVDGVSLIVTKRSEFRSVIQHDGFDGLMRRMDAALQRIHTAAK